MQSKRGGGHQVAEQNIKNSAAERQTLAILYAETRGFTRMSEILEPAIVLARVAEFFAFVGGAVERHGGTVRSLLNDNLVATFAGPDNAASAVEAAQEIQRDFAAIEEAWQRDYSFRTAVAMGLHLGDAVIGELASPLPAQMLIIGDGLSIAERLLHRARAGELVLSKAVMAMLQTAGIALEAEQLPELAIPRREPIPLYGVLLDTRLDFTD
jgi:adenylate cyclase